MPSLFTNIIKYTLLFFFSIMHYGHAGQAIELNNDFDCNNNPDHVCVYTYCTQPISPLPLLIYNNKLHLIYPSPREICNLAGKNLANQSCHNVFFKGIKGFFSSLQDNKTNQYPDAINKTNLVNTNAYGLYIKYMNKEEKNAEFYYNDHNKSFSVFYHDIFETVPYDGNPPSYECPRTNGINGLKSFNIALPLKNPVALRKGVVVDLYNITQSPNDVTLLAITSDAIYYKVSIANNFILKRHHLASVTPRNEELVKLSNTEYAQKKREFERLIQSLKNQDLLLKDEFLLKTKSSYPDWMSNIFDYLYFAKTLKTKDNAEYEKIDFSDHLNTVQDLDILVNN